MSNPKINIIKNFSVKHSLHTFLLLLLLLHSLVILQATGAALIGAEASTVKILAWAGIENVVVAIASIFALNYWLLQPLFSLSRKAELILEGRGNTLKIPQTQRQDELGALAQAIACAREQIYLALLVSSVDLSLRNPTM